MLALDISQEISEGWHDKITHNRMKELFEESNNPTEFFELVSEECLEIKKFYKNIEKNVRKTNNWDAIHAFKPDNFLRNHCLYKIDIGDEPHIYQNILRKLDEKQIDKQAVKNKSITAVARSFGIEVRRNKINCPFHEDKTESCHLYEKDNNFYCFGCNKGGDIIQFVMDFKGWGFKDACNFLINFI